MMNFNTDSRSQIRKTNKPLTERRRRERINKSLQQLKKMVLRASNKEENMKLEKADIMEMTVRFLQDIQQKQQADDTDKTQVAMGSYIQGYSSCLKEVSAVLNTPYISNEVRSTVSSQLTSNFNAMTTTFYQLNSSFSKEDQFHLQSSDRIFTSTPCNAYPTDDRSCDQLSPIYDTGLQDSPMFNSFEHSNSATIHHNSQRYFSPSCDSDSGIDSPSCDSSVWRPW